MFKIHWLFPTTYHNVATTWYNVLQRGNIVLQRSTTWLQRSKNVTEREQNACTMLGYVSATLWYDTLPRCGRQRSNEAQRGTTWRQRPYSVAAARHNPTLIFSVTCQSSHNGTTTRHNVASTWRQCGTRPEFFSEHGDQKRGTTARPKRNAMTRA